MYYPLFSQYSSVFSAIFNVETYDCTNTLWLEKCGDKGSASFYRLDSSFPYPAASTFYIMLLIYIILYISVTLKCFSENNKTERFRSVLFNLLSEEQFLYTIER